MVKIDIDEIDIFIGRLADVREYILKTLLFLVRGDVHEAEGYLETAIEFTYDVEEYLEKLKDEAVEEFEREHKR